MFWTWVKKHISIVVTILVTISFLVFCYGCESKVESLNGGGVRVNRQELQSELDYVMSRAAIRVASLDQQDKLKTLILQNALVLVQGQPFNPVGIITGIATIYGISQAGSNATKTVKKIAKKRKVNNGDA